jgi:hypothetical protein
MRSPKARNIVVVRSVARYFPERHPCWGTRPVSSETVDIRGFLRGLMGYWLRASILVFFALVLGVVYLRSATYRYTITTEVASTDQSINPTLSSSLAILRTGLPINLRTDLNMELFLSEMMSIEIAQKLAQDQDLLHAMFSARWDKQRQEWRQPSPTIATLRQWLGLPEHTHTAPTADDVQSFMEKNIEVRRTAASPVVTLVLKDKDPAFAVKLLTSAYGLVDGNLRAQSLQRAQQRLDFLQDYLTKTTLEDYRRELVLALVDQVRTLMAGKLPAAFAVYVISQPWSTDYPTEPTARVVFAFAVFAGLAFTAFTIFVLPAKRPQRQARGEPVLGPVEELP